MNYKAYFALEKQLQKIGYDVERGELVLSFTEGRTESLRELTPSEYRQFIGWIKSTFDLPSQDWEQSPENQMRRKIYALFVHKMDYTEEGLEKWCIRYGKYHKKLNKHTYSELVELVAQAENTYASYTKAIAGS